MKKSAEFAVINLLENVAHMQSLTPIEQLEEGLFGSKGNLLAVHIPIVMPNTIKKDDAMRLAFVQQGKIAETISANLSSAVASGGNSVTKVLKTLIKENEDYVRELTLQAKNVETIQKPLEEKIDYSGVEDFTSRRQSSGVARSPYTFISVKYDKQTSKIPLATSLGLGAVQTVELRVGIRCYVIFEDEKTMATTCLDILNKKGKYSTLFKRLKISGKESFSILDVLRGKDVKIRNLDLKRDLSISDPSFSIMGVFKYAFAKSMIVDKSWLSSVRGNPQGSLVLSVDILEYLKDNGFDLLEPLVMKEFIQYSKAFEVSIIDQEYDKLYVMDRQTFSFNPHSLGEIVDATKSVIRKAEISLM